MYDTLLETMFRDASDPVVLLRSDRRVASANPAFRALVRWARPGTDFMDLVAFPARDRVGRELVRAAGGEEVLVDVPHAREDAHEQVVEYRFFPVEGGLVAGIGRLREQERALGEELGRAQAELRQKSRILDEIQLELTQVPFIDPVTGVWNRLQVFERLAGEWSRGERYGNPICCLLLEVDGLDGMRRREGAALADDVLKAVARRIKSVVRDHDIVGRYTGDVFVVIAVQSDGEGARHLARRIRECLTHEPIAVGGRTISVDVRVGGSTSRSEGVEILEDLLTVAESALADARTQSSTITIASEPAF